MRLFLFSILFPIYAMAANWEDLKIGQEYKLAQSFQLPQKLERSGSLLDFTRGQSFRLKDIVPVDVPYYPLQLYIFEDIHCPGPQMSTELEIISVQETSRMVEVGAEYDNCRLNVFVELKDYYFQSLFE